MASYSTLPQQSSPATPRPQQTEPGKSRPGSTKEVSEEVRAHSPPSRADRHASPVEWWVDWILKIIGVTAAVLFGIWAPLSWKSTEDGNGTQSSMASALSDASTQASQALDQASKALSLQSSVATVQSALSSTIDAMGRLQIASFCLEQSVLYYHPSAECTVSQD